MHFFLNRGLGFFEKNIVDQYISAWWEKMWKSGLQLLPQKFDNLVGNYAFSNKVLRSREIYIFSSPQSPECWTSAAEVE